MNSDINDLDLGATIRGFAVGQKLFDRYTLQSIIGRGGMGVVWLARDEQLERQVALKFLPDLLLVDQAALDELKHETKRSLELTHHHIVRIYNFEQDSHAACISMEYVDGLNLSALRVQKETRVFEVNELAPLVVQLCDALEYAHDTANIVHRDLKPANLMVNSRGDLKITDFGISRSLSDSVTMLTRQSTSGTLLYMSPQQLNGERVSPLDDIYSLGATIYDLLTSKPPFYGGSIEKQVHEKIPRSMAERRKELEIASKTPIPAHWEETIAEALAKDPAQRPQSARELSQQLVDRAAPIRKTKREKLMVPVSAGGAASQGSKVSRRAVIMSMAGMAILVAAIGITMSIVRRPTSVPANESSKPSFTATVAPTPAPVPVTGRIIVNTIPAGASVYVDGADQGRSPLVIENVAEGIHRLRVEADGWEDASLIAEVKPGATVDMGTLHLTAKPTPAPTQAAATYSPPPPLPETTSPPQPEYDYRGFVLQHLQKCTNGDVSGIVADYADSVDYYENGMVTPSFIAKDRRKYMSSWPTLSIQMTSPVSYDTSNAPHIRVNFSYTFEARNGRKVSRGQTDNTWFLLQTPTGLKIASEKQTITNRSRR